MDLLDNNIYICKTIELDNEEPGFINICISSCPDEIIETAVDDSFKQIHNDCNQCSQLIENFVEQFEDTGESHISSCNGQIDVVVWVIHL